MWDTEKRTKRENWEKNSGKVAIVLVIIFMLKSHNFKKFRKCIL